MHDQRLDILIIKQTTFRMNLNHHEEQESAQTQIKNLAQTIARGTRDTALLKATQKYVIENTSIHEYNIIELCRLMIRIYDTSLTIFNDPLFQLRLKLFAMKMIKKIMDVYYSGKINADIEPQIFSAACEIMIIAGRMCLDKGTPQFLKEVEFHYHYCTRLLNSTRIQLHPNLQFIHLLNICQLLKNQIMSNELSLLKNFKQKFSQLKGKEFQPFRTEITNQYLDQMILEIAVKYLKAGKIEVMSQLQEFFPRQKYEQLASVVQNANGNRFSQNIEKQSGNQISQFYQLYNHLKNNPENISQAYLKQFLTNDRNFQDLRIFDMVAISGNLMPLKIWFQISNSKKNRGLNLREAYSCFVYCVDTYLSKNTGKSNQGLSFQIMDNQGIQKDDAITNYIDLSRLILFSMLCDQKQSREPIINIIKRLFYILIQSIKHIQKYQTKIKQICQKLVLVCVKHGVSELTKTVYSLQLYHLLLLSSMSQERNQKQDKLLQKEMDQVFAKFNKGGHTQKSSGNIHQTLKLAYNLVKGRTQLSPEEIAVLSNKPCLSIIFGAKLNSFLIFTIPMSQFLKIKQPLKLYTKLFLINEKISSKSQSFKNYQKLINHMEEFFQLIQLKTKSLSSEDLESLKNVITILLNRQNQAQNQQNQAPQLSQIKQYQLSRILLMVDLLEKHKLFLQQKNFGVLINKFSKITKIIEFTEDSICFQDTAKICELLILNAVRRFKFSHIRYQNKAKPETGQAIFINKVIDYWKKYTKSNEITKNRENFIKFNIFELQCLINSTQLIDIIGQRDTDLLTLYYSSVFAPKQLRVLIIKKILKAQLSLNSSIGKLISLQMLKDLILLTQSEQQCKLYLQQMFFLFPDTVKNYLMLQGKKHQKIERLLLSFYNTGFNE